MCIKYKPLPIPETEFTAYKIYLYNGSLTSPYKYKQSHGVIEKPGTFTIQPPKTCFGYHLQQCWHDRDIDVPVQPEFTDYLLDVPGFHVIATHKEAELYKQNLLLDRRMSSPVVVPVKVHPSHVYATGYTIFGEYKPNGEQMYEIVTYVTQQITITDTDFPTKSSP